ncbi:hypothetical protein [Fuscovulum ytuae]|uniref:Glycosyltransferase RgtA/B/C/D-like domain-containing protein n=1 Tax=Fuscovulum ytuae TaxID=3042299 RepID=A0ABY8Q3H8_9RHOB|nr:hypothetical protein [Fuscovulum sp. YMD61]WGV15410.1 hypothetical protein QF092_14235 [Fuscovulum sp. YMD61]
MTFALPDIRISTLLVVAAILPLLLSVMLGLKTFEIWSQITYMWEADANPLVELAQINPHSLRYMLLYLVLVTAEFMGWHHDTLFSYILVGLCFFTVRNLVRTVAITANTDHVSYLVQIGCAAIVVILFYLMNGRIGFAFLGYSILLLIVARHYYQRRFDAFSAVSALVGLGLSSVSSGTLISAVLCLVIALYFEVIRSFQRVSLTRTALFALLSCLVLGVLFFRFFLVGINKNIAFYGGGGDGFLRMLEHGAGRSIYPALSAVGLPTVVALALAMAVLFAMLLYRLRQSFMLHILLAAMVCGAFGFSTLSLAALPVLVVASALLISRVPDRRLWPASDYRLFTPPEEAT